MINAQRCGVVAVWLGILILIWTHVGWALTDAELIAIRDAFDARRNSVLQGQVSSPYPEITSDWGKQDYALSALYLGVELDNANQEVINACFMFLTNPDCPGDCSLHWQINLLGRIYDYFNADSSYFPGRLTSAAEDAICRVLWYWLDSQSKVADAALSKVWYIWGSENHDAMHDTSSWHAAKILKDVPPYNGYNCDDGQSVRAHYDAWTAFFKEYLRERAKKGLLVELGSHTYSKYMLQGWYNFYDFAEDPTLRGRAGMLLDLWWADWAHDQIAGVRSGGKSRVYQGYAHLGGQDAAYDMAGMYLGPPMSTTNHPGCMCLVTSTYRLPLVVMDIALDRTGKGAYESRSRRPGLKLLPRPGGVPDDVYVLDPNFGGIHRYVYATPEFVMGTCMREKRSEDDWSAISIQNTWHGVIFYGNPDWRIFPQCVALAKDTTYNQQWSAQNKGTMIVQKLMTDTPSGDMRVWFANGMTREESDGWVLVQTPYAYAAVKPAWGGYTWDDTNWLKCTDAYAPVIIEVARASDYKDMYAYFKTLVLNQTINVSNGVLTYTGMGGSGSFTFYTNTSQVPEINGVPVNYAPDYTFDSPFMHEDWASGEVTISKAGRELVLDFNKELPSLCGD